MPHPEARFFQQIRFFVENEHRGLSASLNRTVAQDNASNDSPLPAYLESNALDPCSIPPPRTSSNSGTPVPAGPVERAAMFLRYQAWK